MIREQLADALKDAMRNREQVCVSTIRLILAAIKDRDIAARTKGQAEAISDDEIAQLFQTMLRQRSESIGLYEQGCRIDLAERERSEIDVIRRFMPAQMGEADINEAVGQIIAEAGAASLKDMGRIMAALRSRYAGRMDFAKASSIVKRALA